MTIPQALERLNENMTSITTTAFNTDNMPTVEGLLLDSFTHFSSIDLESLDDVTRNRHVNMISAMTNIVQLAIIQLQNRNPLFLADGWMHPRMILLSMTMWLETIE